MFKNYYARYTTLNLKNRLPWYIIYHSIIEMITAFLAYDIYKL